MNKHLLVTFTGLIALVVWACQERGAAVATPEQLAQAIASAVPGQTIIMKDGIWQDVEILFEANGKEGLPITLKGQTPGKVFISGRSNLTLAGNYLVVQGLVFSHGYSPTGSVISFRKDAQTLANYSRVTEVVIDRFNKPDRFEPDIWVTVFGKHNRFDHNHLVGKMNQGVTMAVRLDDAASQQNYHVISSNYFGPRPVLGANGGETLRIGTSHHSLRQSNTLVENNVFDRCDGEVEIISVKSGANVLRSNLFFESAGTLTLRHGNGNLVEGNAFIGNGKPHTGGIRVINADHTIRHNYLENLTGHRFGGGLVVMNGVPNSPINRYHPVRDVRIENNTLVDVDHVQLAAGADAERSQAPVNTVFTTNLLVATRPESLRITAYDDISGIHFDRNGVSGFEPQVDISAVEAVLAKGSGQTHDRAERLGAKLLELPSFDTVGVSWYPKGDLRAQLNQGRKIAVQPGFQTLEHALRDANPGDTLVLAAGDYAVDRLLEIAFPLSIVGAGKAQTRVSFTRNSLFEIQDGGSLSVSALTIDGSRSDDTAGNSLIRTSRYGMLNNYQLLFDGVRVENLNVNHSYSLLKATKSTLADRIVLKNSEFSQVSGDLLQLDAERDDLGIFNADYVVIESSQFDAIEGRVASIYRGGTDESTFGPHLTIVNSVFNQSGVGKRNPVNAVLSLVGVQYLTIADSRFNEGGRLLVDSLVGEPVYQFDNNTWHVQPQIRFRGGNVTSGESAASE